MGVRAKWRAVCRSDVSKLIWVASTIILLTGQMAAFLLLYLDERILPFHPAFASADRYAIINLTSTRFARSLDPSLEEYELTSNDTLPRDLENEF